MDHLLRKLAAANSSVAAEASQDLFSGEWKNQLSSRMMLTVDGQGQVTGTYTTAVGQPDSRQSPLIGFVSNDIIKFTVNFGRSLAAWSGQLQQNDQGQEELDTLWHLIVNVPEEEEPSHAWKDTYTGSDRFHRA